MNSKEEVVFYIALFIITFTTIDVLGIYFLVCKFIKISLKKSIIFIIYLLIGLYITSFIIFPFSIDLKNRDNFIIFAEGKALLFAIVAIVIAYLCFVAHKKITQNLNPAMQAQSIFNLPHEPIIHSPQVSQEKEDIHQKAQLDPEITEKIRKLKLLYQQKRITKEQLISYYKKLMQ